MADGFRAKPVTSKYSTVGRTVLERETHFAGRKDLTNGTAPSTLVLMVIPFWRKVEPDTQYKVDINPSYEWAPEAESLNVSHRELEVLALVVEGYKNKEIAKILKIEHQSVKNHLQHLFKKLNVKNNTQAYIIALNLNMIRMRSKLLPVSICH